jgi:hypothetical protein
VPQYFAGRSRKKAKEGKKEKEKKTSKMKNEKKGDATDQQGSLRVVQYSKQALFGVSGILMNRAVHGTCIRITRLSAIANPSQSLYSVHLLHTSLEHTQPDATTNSQKHLHTYINTHCCIPGPDPYHSGRPLFGIQAL